VECPLCPQNSIRLEALAYLCDCLIGVSKDNKWSEQFDKAHYLHRQMFQSNLPGGGNMSSHEGTLAPSGEQDCFPRRIRLHNPIGKIDRFSHFWATVCKTVRPMLSDRCPVCPVCLSVCLSNCDVDVLWPNGCSGVATGGLGGTRPPTCPKDRFWDSSKSDEKLVSGVGVGVPLCAI